MRPTLIDLLDSDLSKMTEDRLIKHIEQMQIRQKKDFRQMLEDEMEGRSEHHGFIYVLSHESMPGLLKVGFTTGSVEKRAFEISKATGVPGPFKIEKKLPVYSDPQDIERKVHRILDPYRKSKNREFFQMSVENAIPLIQTVVVGKYDPP